MNQLKQVEKIRASYVQNECTKLEQLKKLDKKVKRSVKIFSYIFGSFASLVFGTGMCLAMQVIGNTIAYSTYLGVAVGVLGILLISVNYPIYKRVLIKRKKKYADQINALSNELLNK